MPSMLNWIYSRFTGKCNTLRHWSSLYPLPGQGLQVKANVANLFEMTSVNKDFTAPLLFNGSLDVVTFARWLAVH